MHSYLFKYAIIHSLNLSFFPLIPRSVRPSRPYPDRDLHVGCATASVSLPLLLSVLPSSFRLLLFSQDDPFVTSRVTHWPKHNLGRIARCFTINRLHCSHRLTALWLETSVSFFARSVDVSHRHETIPEEWDLVPFLWYRLDEYFCF